MYYLGIDPGLSEVGFGIIEVKKGEPQYVDCGIIKTLPSQEMPERLIMIKHDIREILGLHKYEAVGIEELFFVKNITNGIKVAQARGVILAEAHEKGFPIYEMKPSEIKNNLCGSGSADKTQVQEMVKRLLGLSKLPKPHDAADALGIALLTARLHNR
ncbi:crossover junction endodeoxyribonuclease RuvC [Candidatus Peregrinibacteria bacterium]|nr:crossover junction endodeoxyribonuclease RuvC [Candidatus Peregrinibacteria bacterium]